MRGRSVQPGISVALVRDANEVVTAYWVAANDRDWAAFGDLLAEEVVYEGPRPASGSVVVPTMCDSTSKVSQVTGTWWSSGSLVRDCPRPAGSSSRTPTAASSQGSASSSFTTTGRSLGSPTSGRIRTSYPPTEHTWSRSTDRSLWSPSRNAHFRLHHRSEADPVTGVTRDKPCARVRRFTKSWSLNEGVHDGAIVLAWRRGEGRDSPNAALEAPPR